MVLTVIVDTLLPLSANRIFGGILKLVSDLNFDKYKRILQFVGSMSSLYSNSDIPLIHPRLVEKLFCYVTGATDLGRQDSSFDACINGEVGVGVKTFRVDGHRQWKTEKVAEFTKVAKSGFLQGKSQEELAFDISELRNARVLSDSAEYDIDLNRSIYHCLVRVPGGAYVHEEGYELVNPEDLKPTDPMGRDSSSFGHSPSGHVYFRDNANNYMYNVSKNVLYKRFELNHGRNSETFPINIVPNLIELIENTEITFAQAQTSTSRKTSLNSLVLPLYSTSGGTKAVSLKSGINHWNAGGRQRSFGESYIPVPMKIHQHYPNFFPPHDTKFRLRLPNNKVILAKICQQNGKALMSDPNTDLCSWLFSVIDGSFSAAQKRMTTGRTYAYSDLLRIGKDAVVIKKLNNVDADYEISSAPIGSYESQFSSNLDAD